MPAAGCVAALLLHGAGAGGWEWGAWRGVFEAAGIAVAAPDLAPAPAGLAATRWQDYAAQAAAQLAALPRPRAVVGASLGGLLALQVAGNADALVLVNPLPPSPWHALLAGRAARDDAGIVPWGRDARLAGTVRAMPDADPVSRLHAFRRWRDESGAVLREAYAGEVLPRPAVRALCLASEADGDVPAAATQAVAAWLGADLLRLPGASHVGPLLGRRAAAVAGRVADWLSAP